VGAARRSADGWLADDPADSRPPRQRHEAPDWADQAEADRSYGRHRTSDGSFGTPTAQVWETDRSAGRRAQPHDDEDTAYVGEILPPVRRSYDDAPAGYRDTYPAPPAWAESPPPAYRQSADPGYDPAYRAEPTYRGTPGFPPTPRTPRYAAEPEPDDAASAYRAGFRAAQAESYGGHYRSDGGFDQRGYQPEPPPAGLDQPRGRRYRDDDDDYSPRRPYRADQPADVAPPAARYRAAEPAAYAPEPPAYQQPPTYQQPSSYPGEQTGRQREAYPPAPYRDEAGAGRYRADQPTPRSGRYRDDDAADYLSGYRAEPAETYPPRSGRYRAPESEDYRPPRQYRDDDDFAAGTPDYGRSGRRRAAGGPADFRDDEPMRGYRDPAPADYGRRGHPVDPAESERDYRPRRQADMSDDRYAPRGATPASGAVAPYGQSGDRPQGYGATGARPGRYRGGDEAMPGPGDATRRQAAPEYRPRRSRGDAPLALESGPTGAYPATEAPRRPMSDSTGAGRGYGSAGTFRAADLPPLAPPRRPRPSSRAGGDQGVAAVRAIGAPPLTTDTGSTPAVYRQRATAAVPAGRAAPYRPDAGRSAGSMTSTQSRIRAVEPAEPASESHSSAGYLAAVAYTALWFAVPVVGFALWSLTLNQEASANCVTGVPCSSERKAALLSLAAHLPNMIGILLLSAGIAVVLRRISGTWKASTVGFAAAVVGGGLATVAVSAITGQALG